MKRSTKETIITALMLLGFTMTLAIFSGCGTGKPGSDGSDGIPGAKGDVGQPGVDGHAGATGPAGADSTIATIVQLCPGAPSYPGVFVEVALCINNELYGVYSANGGFLTKLPPGYYNSNGIGSACNLTVYADCIVGH